MSNAQRSTFYKKTFEMVRAILNYSDPEYLSPGKGAPINEYELETAPVASFLIRHIEDLRSDPATLITEINRVWAKNFDRPCPDADVIATEMIKEFSVEKMSTYLCLVCGFPELEESPISKECGGSYEICPSCGFQFGYHPEESILDWRKKWIDYGMPWQSGGPKPKNWDPMAQLKNITD